MWRQRWLDRQHLPLDVDTDPGATRWHFVVDNLNIDKSASLVRAVAAQSGSTDALGKSASTVFCNRWRPVPPS